MRSNDLLAIGEVATRSGLACSALRFYEEQGLITSGRTGGGQRRYHREVLRRLAFVRAAQRVGLSLGEVADALAELPDDRAPSARQWERLATRWRARLDERIVLLEKLRDDLGSCIGCGCLSLPACRLFNHDDGAAALGDGPRYLFGDSSADVVGRVDA